MTTFSISYDLHNPHRDYKPLISALEKAGAARLLESLWLFSTTSTSAQVREWVDTLIDSDDSVAVLQIGPGWATRNVRPEGLAFLKKHHP